METFDINKVSYKSEYPHLVILYNGESIGTVFRQSKKDVKVENLTTVLNYLSFSLWCAQTIQSTIEKELNDGSVLVKERDVVITPVSVEEYLKNVGSSIYLVRNSLRLTDAMTLRVVTKNSKQVDPYTVTGYPFFDYLWARDYKLKSGMAYPQLEKLRFNITNVSEIRAIEDSELLNKCFELMLLSEMLKRHITSIKSNILNGL